MAIYAPVAEVDLRRLTSRFGLRLKSAEGVPQGSINTNYRLTCVDGRYFLRFTTVRGPEALDFEAGLLSYLKAAAFPCPAPLVADDGKSWVAFKDGFVSVFPYVAGEEIGPGQARPEHCGRVGQLLGKLHRLAGGFAGQRGNPYGEATLQGWIAGLQARPLEPEVAEAVQRAKESLPRTHKVEGLARGPIHGDLFRDNVKWLGEQIAAVIDFEMACVDDFALDVGIALDVWTFGATQFDRPRVRALMDGYRAERRMMPEEAVGLWGRALFGAIRYTLSRIRDFHLATAGPAALERKPWTRYRDRMDALLALGPEGFRELAGA